MAINKSYDVGDTVYVRYPFPHTSYFTPQERVISKVEILNAADDARITFTNGSVVNDTTTSITIFTTEALCAAAIINDVIAKSAATTVLDATVSEASTAGNASSTLGRIG